MDKEILGTLSEFYHKVSSQREICTDSPTSMCCHTARARSAELGDARGLSPRAHSGASSRTVSRVSSGSESDSCSRQRASGSSWNPISDCAGFTYSRVDSPPQRPRGVISATCQSLLDEIERDRELYEAKALLLIDDLATPAATRSDAVERLRTPDVAAARKQAALTIAAREASRSTDLEAVGEPALSALPPDVLRIDDYEQTVTLDNSLGPTCVGDVAAAGEDRRVVPQLSEIAEALRSAGLEPGTAAASERLRCDVSGAERPSSSGSTRSMDWATPARSWAVERARKRRELCNRRTPGGSQAGSLAGTPSSLAAKRLSLSNSLARSGSDCRADAGDEALEN